MPGGIQGLDQTFIFFSSLQILSVVNKVKYRECFFCTSRYLGQNPPEADMLFLFETITCPLSHPPMFVWESALVLEYNRKTKKTFPSWSYPDVCLYVCWERDSGSLSPSHIQRVHSDRKNKVNNR